MDISALLKTIKERISLLPELARQTWETAEKRTEALRLEKELETKLNLSALTTPKFELPIPKIRETIKEVLPDVPVIRREEKPITPIQKAITEMTPEEKWKATGEFTKELAKIIPQAAAKVGVSIYQAPDVFAARKAPEAVKVPRLLQPILGEEITSYAKDAEERILAGENPILAFLKTGLLAAWDTTIVGSLISSGAKMAIKGIKAPSSAHYAAWEALGKPATLEAAKKEYRGLAQVLHPDKPTGSIEAMTALNDAYSIILKEGIPKVPPKPLQAIREIAETLETPVSKIMEHPAAQPYLGVKGLLTEEAGKVPVRPFQPIRPMPAGLAVREVPEKYPKPKVPEAKPKAIAQEEKKYKSAEEFIEKLKPEDMLSSRAMDLSQKLEIFKSETNIEHLAKGLEALKKARQDYLNLVRSNKVKRDNYLIKDNKELVEEAEFYFEEMKTKYIIEKGATQKEIDDFIAGLDNEYAASIVDPYTFYKKLTLEQVDYILKKLTDGGKYRPFLEEKDFATKRDFLRYDIKTDAIKSLLKRRTGHYPQWDTFESQLTDFYNQVVKGTKPEVKPEIKPEVKPEVKPRVKPKPKPEPIKPVPEEAKLAVEPPKPPVEPPPVEPPPVEPPAVPAERNLPAVIRGETFTLGESVPVVSATKEEIKAALKAEQKAQKLEAQEKRLREETIERINRFRGNTETIIENLKSRHLSDEDIANIVLEDGTKLIDTVKIKRNNDGSLSTVLKKSELEDIAKSYTAKLPEKKWEERSMLVEGAEIPIKIAKGFETPALFFERKGLSSLRDAVIKAQRAAQGYGLKGEISKIGLIRRFEEAGLARKGGWFTEDRFAISKKEAEGIARYYLGIQDKGPKVKLEELSERARKFIEIFDGIKKETEPIFFETARKMGKSPGKVENYSPLMTSEDFRLIDQVGAAEWLFRNHPAFFSLKQRMEKVPLELYELDYRKVAAKWIDGITDFIHLSEITNHLKYLINSDQFKKIVSEKDWEFINNWLKEITTPSVPQSEGAKAVQSLSKFGRKITAMGSLGLNYATVIKQALSQICVIIIDKTLPKHRSKFAEAFGIDTARLPSITARKGDIAIRDLQGKIGRTFTGPITEFDRINAQLSVNGYLDKLGKEIYEKWEKTGIEPSREAIDMVVKTAQDRVDLWYGSFYKGDRPDFYKKETGNFLLMFTYPLNSQLNGFFRHILKAGGYAGFQGGEGKKTIIAAAEVLAAATTIAYLEQVIESLSPKWSDEVEMTKDILQSLAGNIPMLGNIVYAFLNEKEINISPIIANANSLVRSLNKDDKEEIILNLATSAGIPRTLKRLWEGMRIMEEGGITDNEGKMEVAVYDAMEIVRSFLRGKYGSLAARDWVRNIGEKRENRRWFIPQVEFLQNGDYNRKAQLYQQFSPAEQIILRGYLSKEQKKKLDEVLERRAKSGGLEEIFSSI